MKAQAHIDLNPAVEAAAPFFREAVGGRGPLNAYEWDDLARIVMAASPQIDAQFARWLASRSDKKSAVALLDLADSVAASTMCIEGPSRTDTVAASDGSLRVLGRKAATAQMERDLAFSATDGVGLSAMAKTLIALGWTRAVSGDDAL